MVSDQPLPYFNYYPFKTSEQFDADVAFMRESFPAITYAEMVHRRKNNVRGGGNNFIFTFDDGFAACHDVIRPILQKYQLDGVFFVTTALVDNRELFFESKVSLCLDAFQRMTPDGVEDLAAKLGVRGGEQLTPSAAARLTNNRMENFNMVLPQSASTRPLLVRLLSLDEQDQDAINELCERCDVDPVAMLREQRPYMTSNQIRAMADAGFTIGAHGVAHRRLQSMSRREVESDIVESCDRVRYLTDQKKVPFAFPYSGHGLDRGFLADLMRRHDFIELYFDTGGIRRDAAFVVNRVVVDRPSQMTEVRSNLPGLLQASWARRRAWIAR